MADKNFSARIKKWFIKAYGPMPTVSHVSHNSGDPVGHRGHTFNQRRQSMITHVLTNGDAILEIEVSDNKDTMTSVFKRSDPDIYDEAEFAVTRNPNYPFELLRDIIDQCGFMDQPYFHADGWKLNEDTSAKLDCPTFRFTYRNEIHIKANDQQEAERIFRNMDRGEFSRRSDFVEIVSIDKED